MKRRDNKGEVFESSSEVLGGKVIFVQKDWKKI